MNNAELTDILALTDALLAAGWGQGWGAQWRDAQVRYPTHHCLLGAVAVAVNHLAPTSKQMIRGSSAALALLAAGVPERCPCCLPRVVIAGYNDHYRRTVAEVRALVHAAAERLTK